MITAEEFFGNKLKELQPFRSLINLRDEVITAEQGMRWAHEFNKLVGGKTEREAELLEALKAAMAFIDSHVADPDITTEMAQRYAELINLNPHEIIAKAEGKL